MSAFTLGTRSCMVYLAFDTPHPTTSSHPFLLDSLLFYLAHLQCKCMKLFEYYIMLDRYILQSCYAAIVIYSIPSFINVSLWRSLSSKSDGELHMSTGYSMRSGHYSLRNARGT